jgi:hypothetical protein
MPDASALYPQPPQQQQGALSDPSKLMGFIQAAQAAKIFTARQAIGRAWQNNLNPDGSLNVQGAAQEIKNNPDAGILAPEAYSNVLAQHGQMIANDTAAFDQFAKQNGFAQQWLAARANQPNVTAEDLNNDAASLSRNTDPRALPSSVINSVIDNIKNDPGGIHGGLLNLRNRVIGAAGATQPIEGPPQAGTGAKTTIPLGATGYGPGGQQSGIPGQIVTGLPPGSGESALAMQEDLKRAGTYSSDIYPLNKALEFAQKLGPGGMGPGTQGRQAFESYVYSLMPQLVPEAMQEKIKNYAQLEKYLTNVTQNQAQNFGVHTDAGLATSATGSPNVHINDLAGVDLIKARIGLRNMEQAQIIQATKAGPQNYTAEKARIAGQQDPRAYMLHTKTPEEIDALDKSLKGSERAKFNASLEAAKSAGILTEPGQ